MGNYNKFARKYEKLTEKIEKSTRNHTYSLIKGTLKEKCLLDVGCGSGCDAEFYKKNGAKVYGIDISKKEILIARKKIISGKFKIGNMNSLPYKNETFDIVVSTYALQASNNVIKAINEMIRVAKPNAQILIVTKHPTRNLLEGYVNNNKKDYFEKRLVTSYIFNKKIKLSEPGHPMMEYLDSSILKKAELEIFEEHIDFPASEQVIKGMNYPTYMILKFRKKVGNKKIPWYKINPLEEKDIFLAADKKYGNYSYDEDLRTYFLKQFKKILSALIKETNKKILVGGANSGMEIEIIKKKNKIFALDASKIALEKLSRKSPFIKTVLGDLNSLPFKDNFFDYYVCMRTINSSTVNLKKALSESLRVTKKKGTIILSIPNGYAINKKIQKGLYDYKKNKFDVNKPFKIIKEIEIFYKKHNLPIKTIDFPSEIIIIIKNI